MDPALSEIFKHLMVGDKEDPHRLLLVEAPSLLRDVKYGLKSAPPAEYSARLPPSLITKIHSDNSLPKHREEHANIKETGKFQSRKTMAAPLEHGIAPPLRSLQPISLQQVAQRINYIHEGHVLFATTIKTAFRVVGTTLLVQDDICDCVRVGLYNIVATTEDPATVFPVGTHLAFLCPYMKNSHDMVDQELLLRCDNPQCVVSFGFKFWVQHRSLVCRQRRTSPTSGTSKTI
jgi:hypothetical protein